MRDIVFLLMVIFIISCSKESNPSDNSNSPVIYAVTPDSGRIGDIIKINGRNFSNSGDIAFSNTNASDILSWQNNEIVLKVPAGSSSGNIHVLVNGNKSNEKYFKVIINSINIYDTVKICNQVWMKINLDVATYRNGDPIPEVTDSILWSKLTTGAWCYYNNNPANGSIYGKLYNWYAVNDPRGLAPLGWHIPTDDEWKELEMCLGMTQNQVNKESWRGTDEGGKLKSTGTKQAGTGLWESPNTGATNESGFSALSGGCRNSLRKFTNIGNLGYWWSASEASSTFARSRTLSFDDSKVERYDLWKGFGFSVRCVRDK